jgi:PAS domain S-box-containing protein
MSANLNGFGMRTMRLSLVTKIVLLFTAVILVFMGVSYFQWSQMQRSTRSLYDLNTGYIPLSRIIAQIDTAQKNLQSDVSRVFDVDDTRAQRILTRLAQNYFPLAVTQHITTGIAHCDKLAVLTSAPNNKKFYAEIRDSLVNIRELHSQYQDEARAVFAVIQSESNDYKEQEAALRNAERKIERALKVLSIKMETRLSENIGNLEQQAGSSSWAGVMLSVVAFVLGALITIVSAFQLRPLRRLTEAVQRIGKGEYRYSLNIRSGDELGTLAEEFEHMRTSLLNRDKALKDQAEKLEVSNKTLNTLTLHYENILNTLWLPVIVTDVHLRIKTVNPPAIRLWNLKEEEIAHKKVEDLETLGGRLGDVIPFEDVIRDRRTVKRDGVEVPIRDGGLRRFSMTTVPFQDGERVRGLLILAEDVTDELRVMDSMVHSERNAAVGRITSRIAHEIRNPLSSIALNTEMLEEELGGDTPDLNEIRPLLHSIIREVERLHGITDRYLSFAKTNPQGLGQVVVNRLLANVVEFYHLEMSRHAIRCAVTQPDDPLVAFADENQLVGVLHNLIKNAIEAMEEGGELRVSTESGDDSHISIIIEDSGPGIPAKYAEKIFEPFFSTKESGTGLGLALAQQVLAAMGGGIRLESNTPNGARFIITLPKEASGEHESGTTPLLLD